MGEPGENVTPTETVLEARAGSVEAFTVLVRRYAPMVEAVALARTGRAEIAGEVGQEALLDAWRLLPTLREPAAFGAWLRRVVLKHADRHTRRPTREVFADRIEESVSEEHDLELAVQIRESRRKVRDAIDSLPPVLRESVALFYLSGCSHAEISALVGAPVSAIKKRLHDARRRIQLEVPMSVPSLLPATVEAFVAARSGRVDLLQSALSRRPELVSAVARPDADEIAARYAPHSAGSTLLHEAVAHGRLEIAELLLSRGADPDARTPGGLTPLMLSLVYGQSAMVELLLRRGADPSTRLHNGGRPLHVARHRGLEAAAEALIAAGADPEARDDGGQRASDWARYPGASTPSGGGRTIDPSGRALDGGPPVVIPPRRPAPPDRSLCETQIKAIDLLAPLARGAVHRLDAGAGVGKIVLIGELCRALGPVVVAGLLDRTWDVGDFEPVLRELGAWDGAVVILGASPEDGRVLAEAALSLAESRGGIVVADDRLADDLRALGPATAVITFGPHAHPDPIPDRGAAAAQIVLDPSRAARGEYPAVDPAHSSSIVASGRHAEVAARVREAIAAGGPLAERLLAWLTQPFCAAEEWNGKPGARIPLAATLDEAERILAGEVDARTPSELRYLPGRL